MAKPKVVKLDVAARRLAKAKRPAPPPVKKGATQEGVSGLAPAPAGGGDPIVALVLSQADLFSDEMGEPHAAVRGTHPDTLRLNSPAFRVWLDRQAYARYGSIPKPAERQRALSVVEGIARFDRPREAVHVRLARSDEGIFIDLGGTQSQYVRVTPSGWDVVTSAPVRFRRPKGQRELPIPVAGGTVNELRAFVNVANDDAFVLVVAWLLGTYAPNGPYPLLGLQGEQGSTKSTTTKILRALTDPCRGAVRTLPKSERDLAIMATNGRVLAFDNLSGLSAPLSDALCRAATGGGLSTRQLFTDSDEQIMEFSRPVILNGIDDLATRPDLAERSIVLVLPTVPPHARVDEASLWTRFDEARPRIFGALLTAVCTALHRLDEVKLDTAPRMADFARWVTASEPGLGWSSGTFMAAYSRHRLEAERNAFDDDPLASVLRQIPELRAHAEWSGTPSVLYGIVNMLATDTMKRSDVWPRAANALTNRLRRLATLLRAGGYEVALRRSGSERLIRITRTADPSTSSSSPSRSDDADPSTHDEGDDHDDA